VNAAARWCERAVSNLFEVGCDFELAIVSPAELTEVRAPLENNAFAERAFPEQLTISLLALFRLDNPFRTASA
jgi:hypothetical protein